MAANENGKSYYNKIADASEVFITVVLGIVYQVQVTCPRVFKRARRKR